MQKNLIPGHRYEKRFRFKQTSTSENNRNGVPVGIIEGFASTWGLDRGDDMILQGAFAKTIARHAEEGRPVRMLLQHQSGELIGGFPIEFAKETPEGLFVRGEINLEVQRGREAYALAKQDVLTDMSIGYSIPSRDAVDFRKEGDKVIRIIKEVELWEISMVSEPMNPAARVTAVKAATSFADLPLADRSTPWDSSAALGRVRTLTGSTDAPSERYREAFFWYDDSATENFGSYKLPFADVVDGRLVAIPRGIFSAAAALLGARGGVDIPDGDRQSVIDHVEKYYRKLDLPSPFEKEKGVDVTICEACESLSDVEELLKMLGISSEGRKILISRIKASRGREDLEEQEEGKGREDSESIKQAAEKLDKALAGIYQDSINRTLTRL